MIQGHGYASAKVMLISDGATDDDMASGYAITGSNEKVLRGFAEAHNLRWAEFYRTMLIKDRINLSKPQVNAELVTDDYRRILKNEINTIKPNIIIPLSELSFNFVSGIQNIRKYRGSVLPAASGITDKPTRILPILGPNPYLNEDPTLYFISRLDFGKLNKHIDETGVIKEIGLCWVAKSVEEVRAFFNRHYSKAEFVVFDIETYVGIPSCISFCFDGNESMTVPLLDTNLALETRVLMAHEVSRLLDSPLGKVNQNIKFDWRKLERWKFRVNAVIGDTSIAANCLYPEFPKNLGFLTSIYTEMPYHKDEAKQFDPSIHDRDVLYLYCAKDSLSTNKIYREQLKELDETGTKNVYNKLISILPVYKKMEERGIRIDDTKRQELLVKYWNYFEIQVYKLHKLIGREVNPLSDTQVRHVIYDELMYKVCRGIKYTKGRLNKSTGQRTPEPAVDEESLELLKWRGQGALDGPTVIDSIIAARKIHKVIEYLESPIHSDGRARCEFNLSGAETGRTTTGKTTDVAIIYEFHKKGAQCKYVNLGRSFQNIGKHGFEVEGEHLGKELRSLFVPDPGYCFVECDLSQAEARVDAVLARDFDILAIFDGPIGIHRLTGSWVYDCLPEEIKKDGLVNGVNRYHEAKTVRHAGERNMGEDRLMLMIHQSEKRCAEILRIFHQKQPNIREVFHREIREQIQKNRVLVAPNGRRRDFFSRFDKHMINEGISTLPQMIVTDYLKNPLDKIFLEQAPWAEPLAESHDSILAQVPLARKEEYGQLFKTSVEVPIDFRNCSLSREFNLTIPCEVEWSDTNWEEMRRLL